MLYSLRYLLGKVGLLEKPGLEPGDEDRSAARDRTDGPVMEPLAPFRHSSQNILRLY